MASEHVMEVSDSEFQEKVVSSATPVIVDFWAPWCGPCKKVGPVLDEVASDYQGKVKIAKVNVDMNPKVAGSFGIRSIPTILFFKDGEVVDQLIGAYPKKDIVARVDRILG